MTGHGGRRSPPPIRGMYSRCHAPGSSSAGASSSRRRSADPPPPPTRFADFPDLPPQRPSTRTYLGVRQRSWATWVAEITDRKTHKWKWICSFHTAELAAMEYDRWQVRFHGSDARLNFPIGEHPFHLAAT
nr:ethylene-responsive transcription factor ERF113-like [Aegilops tauschii subsp. strangulata]